MLLLNDIECYLCMFIRFVLHVFSCFSQTMFVHSVVLLAVDDWEIPVGLLANAVGLPIDQPAGSEFKDPTRHQC